MARHFWLALFSGFGQNDRGRKKTPAFGASVRSGPWMTRSVGLISLMDRAGFEPGTRDLVGCRLRGY